MNSTERSITLNTTQINSAVEEYLHRLHLIDADELVNLNFCDGDKEVLFTVKKEVTVH